MTLHLRHRRSRRSVVALGAFLAASLLPPLAARARAQEPAPPPAPGQAEAQAPAREQAQPQPPEAPPAAKFGEELEVTEVFLDVLALDRHGRTVPGLGRDDFVVTEDGEPVEVTSVEYYTTRYEDLDRAGTPRARGAAGAAPAAVPASRYFIFFFHDQSGAVTDESALTHNRLDAARWARQWVRDEMQGSDWIAVVRYTQSLSVLSDFTQDQATILQAIDDAVVGRPSEATRPSVRRRQVARGGPSLLAGLPGSFDLAGSATRPYEAVRLVAEASGNIIGRKNLLLYTLGFGQLDSAFRSPDSRYYPKMAEALNANNVAVYPIDLAGGGVHLDTPQTTFLSQLADDTGGELFKTFNTFLLPLERISDQTTGYYLVTFRARHPAGESGYQKIDVRVKRRGVQVRTRNGYRYGGGSE